MQSFIRALVGVSIWVLSIVCVPAHAQALGEQRLALIIGNGSYKTAPLTNPVNDVRLMETVLKQAGFEVIKGENASLRETRRLVRDFGDKLKQRGGVGLFYFAGHGVQVRGENYLVTIDSDIRNEDEVAEDSLNANFVLEKMLSAGNRMNLVILDACRNNPFAVRSRSSSSGLATMSAPSGSMVAYSTAPGSVASDGTGKNGLYTQHLAQVIAQPGLPVEEVFKQVRTLVRRDSNNQQTPWENTALEGQFYFKPVAVAALAPAVTGAASSDASDAVRLEVSLWDTVKNSGSASELRTYLMRYPQGVFAQVAQSRLMGIEAAGKAALATTVAVAAPAAQVAAPIKAPAPASALAPAALPATPAPAKAPSQGILSSVFAALTPGPAKPAPAAVPALPPPEKTTRPPASSGDFLVGSTRFVGKFASDANNRTWSGVGKVAWSNGDVFEGTLVDGKRQGVGKFSWQGGQYDGDWLDDKAIGKGKLVFKNGDEYTGGVQDVQADGDGVMKFASGDVYQGHFVKGKAQGHGIYQWRNGQSFEGEWLQDQPQGKGVLKFTNGNRYEGEVQNGAPHGTGQLQFAHGDTYKGKFINGQPEGLGEFVWKAGDRYTGQWKAGQKHGEGVFVWANGDRWEGTYQSDQQTANGKLIRR